MPLIPKKNKPATPLTQPITVMKYPELDAIARRIADITCFTINLLKDDVKSSMPYKAQYILEEVIQILKARV